MSSDGDKGLPGTMIASEALDKGLGDQYKISRAYDGPAEKAVGTLTTAPTTDKSNSDHRTDIHTHTGNPPDLVTVAEKYKE